MQSSIKDSLNKRIPFALAFIRTTGEIRPTGAQIRRAVRAVVYRSDRFLLVHSTVNGDYKFPGGGVNLHECSRAALSRELREETGYQLKAVTSLLGVTVELDIPASTAQPFRTVSFYYQCEIDPRSMPTNPDAYERDLGFHPVWTTLEEALANNLDILDTAMENKIFWLPRETAVLRELAIISNRTTKFLSP